jgi:hypothetical protein
MRKVLHRIFFVVLLLTATASRAGAEGTLHRRDHAPSLKNFRSDCRPGRDPSDPHCCADRLSICRIQCKDDYAENGDMLYLRHCERGCEDELRACQAGN